MDRETGPAVLAACAARRWLARNAAGVERLQSLSDWPAPALTSLVSCLPALEDAELHIPADNMGPDDLNCLLEALAWCPLRALGPHFFDDMRDLSPGQYCPDRPAFAKLRSLTKLS